MIRKFLKRWYTRNEYQLLEYPDQLSRFDLLLWRLHSRVN